MLNADHIEMQAEWISQKFDLYASWNVGVDPDGQIVIVVVVAAVELKCTVG